MFILRAQKYYLQTYIISNADSDKKYDILYASYWTLIAVETPTNNAELVNQTYVAELSGQLTGLNAQYNNESKRTEAKNVSEVRNTK